jgi:hypothetical protein
MRLIAREQLAFRNFSWWPIRRNRRRKEGGAVDRRRELGRTQLSDKAKPN